MTYEEALEFLKNRTKLRITLSGDIGSGKSTLAKQLAEKLDMPRIYIGGLMREEAAKRGITLDELGAMQEKDDELDRAMDQLLAERSKTIDKGIFEGRMAWHFCDQPDVKLFLKVEPQVAAQRIWNDTNKTRDQYDSLEEVIDANEIRRQSEEKRYQKFYGLSAYSLENFDVIIDSSNLDVKQMLEKTVIDIAEFLKAQS